MNDVCQEGSATGDAESGGGLAPAASLVDVETATPVGPPVRTVAPENSSAAVHHINREVGSGKVTQGQLERPAPPASPARTMRQRTVQVSIDTVNGDVEVVEVAVDAGDTADAVRAKVHARKEEAKRAVQAELERMLAHGDVVARTIFIAGWVAFPVWLGACYVLCRPHMSKCALGLNIASAVLGVVVASVVVMVILLLVNQP